LTLPALLLALGALALPGPAAGTGSARAAPQTPAEVLERVGFDQDLGAQIPLDARFVDDAGRPVALSDLVAKRPVVLAFVYYECPMLCTLVLNGLVRALRAIDLEAGRDFDVVAVGIDPDETPALAAAKKATYVETYGREGSDAGWHFLTGEEAQIRRVADAAGFRYVYLPDKDQYAHASGILVLTPQGVAARYFYGVEFPPRDLRLGLVEASGGRVGSAVDQVLLFCFHYDPTTGRYGFAIMSTLRLLGVGIVVALVLFILLSIRRERRRRALLAGAGG
jgi:protein SCO1